jgi:hypothetical protein
VNIQELRSEAEEKIPNLEHPESIRTPGRTWTRYPDDLDKQADLNQDIETDINSEGDIEIHTGEEALDKAGQRPNQI